MKPFQTSNPIPLIAVHIGNHITVALLPLNTFQFCLDFGGGHYDPSPAYTHTHTQRGMYIFAVKQRHGQSRENRTSEALIEAEMPIRTVTGK